MNRSQIVLILMCICMIMLGISYTASKEQAYTGMALYSALAGICIGASIVIAAGGDK